MRFHITAALVAAATMLSGVVADDAQTSQATVTLTRTVQRVAATVTATRCSSTTLVPTGSAGASTNGTVVSPILSSTAAARQTGAAVAIKIEMIGLAAAAGLAGFLI